MPIGTAPRFWTWGWHRFEKLPYGCRDMAISMCLAPNMFLRHRESVVETEQMSSVETRQMSQQQSSVLSQQQTSVLSQYCPWLLLAAMDQKVVKKHSVFVYLSSRPGVSCEGGEGQCHQVSIFTTTSRTQAPRPDPQYPP